MAQQSKQSQVGGGNNSKWIFVLFYTISFFLCFNQIKINLLKKNRNRDYTLNIMVTRLSSIYYYHYRKIEHAPHTNHQNWCLIIYWMSDTFDDDEKNGIYSSFFMYMNIVYDDATVKITMSISNLMPRLF